ncbi:inositol monophosphatase family protein [Alteriqipengyuania sp. WL0013]|uniref:inositol monophosphatase family protein n=1 Tax=Alteriqipengyuania sp. WL0013 TaxID=3110773 RepID=UPI002BE3B24E|nr:inositol monophosphatase family protein [Alteriqipengyuania sp. WL0013]MEB3415203.1 inositol monophosphatase family protein [Alteriqipengyuania sp. WL0013]
MRFAAERAILPRFRNLSDEDIVEKAADDLVTVADRETEEFLTEALRKLQPGVPVVGEEAVHADPSLIGKLSGPCWIVDPIDGTHNFAHGKAPFGIMIALADAGEAVAGWIYDPLSGRFCHARRGEGAFIGEKRIAAQVTGETPPVAAISVIFLDQARREAVEAHVAPHYRVVETPRCAAEQYPRLALGENDVSFFERTLAWDHAAGALWVNEAGGRIARPDGSPYRVDEPDRTGMIGAASPALWDGLAELYAKLP